MSALDLGPHAAFIWAAYGVTAIAVLALILAVLGDDWRQTRKLAELERRGIRRRSERSAAPSPGPAEAEQAGGADGRVPAAKSERKPKPAPKPTPGPARTPSRSRVKR